MSLITLPNTELVIDIPNFAIGSKTYKRKLRVVKMEYNIENKNVLSEGVISFYKRNDDDSYGDAVTAEDSIVARPLNVHLLANNETYVDAATGRKICYASNVGDENSPESPVHGKTYMGEFDFFFGMASGHQIVINEMLRTYYLQAVSDGRFD